jgi:hypothetical protein
VNHDGRKTGTTLDRHRKNVIIRLHIHLRPANSGTVCFIGPADAARRATFARADYTAETAAGMAEHTLTQTCAYFRTPRRSLAYIVNALSIIENPSLRPFAVYYGFTNPALNITSHAQNN